MNEKIVYVVVVNYRGDEDDALVTFNKDEAISVARKEAKNSFNDEVRIEVRPIPVEDDATAKEAWSDFLDLGEYPDCDLLSFLNDSDVDELVEAVCRSEGLDLLDGWYGPGSSRNSLEGEVGFFKKAFDELLEKSREKLNSFAAKVKAVRLASEMTRPEISDKTDVPVRTLENWESGAAVPPPYVQKMFIELMKKVIEE